jgi:hypothetical protein
MPETRWAVKAGEPIIVPEIDPGPIDKLLLV